MSTNDWAKHVGKWGHVWALTTGGVVALAVIVFAGQKNWFADDTLFGFALLGVASGVFGAAYALTSRQLKVDAQNSLIEARSTIERLTAQVEKLTQELEAAKKKLNRVENNLTSTDMAYLAADIASAETSLAAAQLSAMNAALDLGKATKLFADIAEDLPERHRLVGLWVAAGLTIVLLGFAAATGLTVSTSSDGSTNSGTTSITGTGGTTGETNAPETSPTETG